MLRFVFSVLVSALVFMAGKSMAVTPSWTYEKLVDFHIYDCISSDANKLYVCGLGGIIDVSSNQWVVKDTGTVYKSFHRIDGHLACFNVRNQLVWFDETGTLGKTRFATVSNGNAPLEIKEIVEEKSNYLFLLHAPVRLGKMYFYFAPKERLSNTSEVCVLESAIIRRYKGDGETGGVDCTDDGTMILYGDDGIFQVEPTFKTVKEDDDTKVVFKDYSVQRIFSELKGEVISNFVQDTESDRMFFSGSGLWCAENGVCTSVDVPSCYVQPSITNVADMILFENRVWLISKEHGIIAYHLDDTYYEQDNIFEKPFLLRDSIVSPNTIAFPSGGNINTPSFHVTDQKIYVISNRGLWQLIPRDFDRKQATIIAVGINHFLDAPVRNKKDSLQSWHVVKKVLEQACKDYFSQGIYLYGWPKDTALRHVCNDTVAPNFIRFIEEIIYNRRPLVPTHNSTFWNPQELIQMLRPEMHLYDSVRIITISNGRDQFLPKEKMNLSSIIDSCGTKLSVNLINAKFKVASIHAGSRIKRKKKSWRARNLMYLKKLHDSNQLELQVFNFDEQGDLDANALACGVLKALFNRNCSGVTIEPAARGEMYQMMQNQMRFDAEPKTDKP